MMKLLKEYKAIIESISCPEEIQAFLNYGGWELITDYRNQLADKLNNGLLDDTETGWLQDVDAIFANKLCDSQLAEWQSHAPGLPVREWWGHH